jgi:hypothetical protein
MLAQRKVRYVALPQRFRGLTRYASKIWLYLLVISDNNHLTSDVLQEKSLRTGLACLVHNHDIERIQA